MKCKIEFCLNEKIKAKKMCEYHYNKEWRKNNPEKKKQYDKTKNLRHRDKINARHRKNWHLKNRWLKEKQRREKPEIKIKYLKSLVDYYQRNPEITSRWENQTWSKFIKTRDKHICQVCQNNGNNAHHLLYRQLYPKLTLNTNNGITLCNKCHLEVHGRKTINTKFYPFNLGVN